MADVADRSHSFERRFRAPSYGAEESGPERQAWVQVHNVRDVLRPEGAVDGKRHSARVQDLSLGGLVLTLAHRFEAGTPLEVEIGSATAGEPPVQLLVRVMVCSNPAENTFVVSCCFLHELNADELQMFGADCAVPDRSDGRAWVRFPSKLEALYHAVVAAEHAPGRARIVNISAGGVALQTKHDFERGTLLNLELRGLDGQPLQPRLARVVHASRQDDGDFMLGCTFVRELSDADLRTLMT